MDSIYDRQKTLGLKYPSLTIVGCGGIGYWAAKFAAMSGITKIYLFDPDRLEDTNLNRLDFPESSIGTNKADATREVINTIRPMCSVYVRPFILQEHTFEKTDWMIDCTDNIKSQLENQRISQKFGSRYVKAGYDGEHITIADSVAEWGEAPDGYITTPSWVVPAVTVAALVIGKVMRHTEKELSKNIDKLFD